MAALNNAQISVEFVATADSSSAGLDNAQVEVLYIGHVASGAGDIPAYAWSFDFDGHSFFVLTLGVQGTYVYDTLTKCWSRFYTTGHASAWNAAHGMMWNKRPIYADMSAAKIWQLSPGTTSDEGFIPITQCAVGGVAQRNRRFSRNFAFRLVASAGSTGAEASVRLRWSDDGGVTWSAYYTKQIATGDTSKELAWRSLGMVKAPGRIYEVSSVGGVARIDSATAEIEELEDQNGK